MKVIKAVGSHKIKCPNGGFTSFRPILEKDGLGYSITETHINAGGPYFWHYKNHLETCYCVSGSGELEHQVTGEKKTISPGELYIVGPEDPHTLTAHSNMVLICVFNPPLTGDEVHKNDGSY